MLTRTELSRLATALGGLPVLGCFAGSPAAEAGVRYGDVLLAVDGKPTATWEQFVEAREAMQTGEFTARVFRDGKELDIHVKLRGHPNRSLAEMLEELGELRILAASDSREGSGGSLQ